MTKLNQIIAIEKGVKSRTYSELTELDKAAQKPELFNGFTKTYERLNEDSEELPSERKKVQYTVPDVLQSVKKSMVELFDVTARKDWTNCTARANVTVGDKVIIEKAPVTYLLFLEKQLTDMRTLIGRLPVLDDSESWSTDPNSGLYRTEPLSTHRTKKVEKPIVLYDATPEHPAQTQLITQDVLVGHWRQTKLSGAMPKPERDATLARVEKLLHAVKQAREEANSVEAVDSTPGVEVFSYLFG